MYFSKRQNQNVSHVTANPHALHTAKAVTERLGSCVADGGDEKIRMSRDASRPGMRVSAEEVAAPHDLYTLFSKSLLSNECSDPWDLQTVGEINVHSRDC